MTDVRLQWQRFGGDITPETALRPLILESWSRSQQAGVDREPVRIALRRVPPDELARRQAAAGELLEVARPHLEWLSSTYDSLPHAAYVVDRDGIVLWACGTDPQALEMLVHPGIDWSEASCGTNGAGTALVAGEPVAVEGAEHYVQTFRDYTCTGAPVRGPAGDIIGAIDLSSGPDPDTRARLLLVAHAAYSISQELLHRDSLRRTQGRLAAERALADERAERLAALEALHAHQERFQALIENAADSVAVLDQRGVVQYASPAHERILGYTPEELVGTNVLDLLHPGDAPGIASIVEPFVRTPGAIISAQARHRHKDGSWRLLQTVGRNLLDHPAVRGLVFNTTDVTERQRLEAQLREAQRLEAVGRLAGGVAHEINNALQCVLGFSSLTLEQLEPAHPSRPDVEETIRSADRAIGVARQLLAFSRRQQLRPQRCSLIDVVHELAPVLRHALGPTRELQLTLGDAPAWIDADPGQLEQVLLNLVLNARDAMPAGGVCAVTIDRLDAPLPDATLTPRKSGPMIRLQVQDTGHGMDEQTRLHIFDPFFTTKGPGEGTGLGLAVAHGIVEQSGGRIWCDSELGRGTTFTVLLPAASAPWAPDDAELAASSAGDGATILVVDDEPPVLVFLARELAKAGYRTVEARDGARALELLEGLSQVTPSSTTAAPVDLVITDIVMPQVGGIDLARRLAERYPELPILFVSGYAGDEAGCRGVVASAPFLQKPFRADELRARVRDVLAKRAEPPPLNGHR